MRSLAPAAAHPAAASPAAAPSPCPTACFLRPVLLSAPGPPAGDGLLCAADAHAQGAELVSVWLLDRHTVAYEYIRFDFCDVLELALKTGGRGSRLWNTHSHRVDWTMSRVQACP